MEEKKDWCLIKEKFSEDIFWWLYRFLCGCCLKLSGRDSLTVNADRLIYWVVRIFWILTINAFLDLLVMPICLWQFSREEKKKFFKYLFESLPVVFLFLFVTVLIAEFMKFVQECQK